MSISAPTFARSSLLTLLALLLCATGLFGCGDSEATGENEDLLTIESPTPDSHVDSRSVTIEGTVDGQYDVMVNGQEAEVAAGEWEATVDYDHDGRVTATAVAGGDEETVDFTIDTVAPEFEIHSPDRGTIIDAAEDEDATVTVSGEMGEVGQSGLQLFEVDGKTVDVEAGESFETEVEVLEGFNELTFKAIDGAHNEVESNRAVIYGPVTDPEEPIDKAARLDIVSPEGIQAVSDIIESYVTPDRILGFLVDGFQTTDGIELDVTDVDWDDLDVELTPTDGSLEIEIAMTNLQVVGDFKLDQDDQPVEGDVTIDNLTIFLDVDPGADENNQLDLEILDKSIETDNVTVVLEGEERDSLGDLAEVAIVVGFEEFVQTLVEDNLYDPSLMTQEVEFLNRTIVFSLLLQDVVVSPTGISVEMGLEFPDDKYEDVAEVPGALNRPVESNPTGSVDRPVLFHTTRTAADRLLHGIWRTGLFHQSIGSDDLSDFQLPFEMTADGVGGLLDSRIRDVHQSDTPAKFRLRPLLPPVVEFRGEEQITARLGDFLVDVMLLPEQGPPTKVVSIALHLDIDLDVTIDDSEVGLDVAIDASGDVADEPLFSFDRESTIDLITELLDVVPTLLNSELQVDAETELEWATVSNPTVKAHGDPRDRATVGVDVEPADDYIGDDDVDDGDDGGGQ